MRIAFVPRPLPVLHSGRKSLQTCAFRPTAKHNSPSPHHRRNRRVRVPRKYTSKQPGWEWRGKKSSGWRSIFGVEESVIKVIEALWSKSLRVSESSILARMTALGVRVLKSMTDAIERTLYPDTEKELVVEYGITEPHPADKTYIDDLIDWEVSDVTYYRDSYGRRVYLQLEGAAGVVVSGDFRDGFDDLQEDEDEDANDDGSTHRLPISEDNSMTNPNARKRTFEKGSDEVPS